MRINIKPKKLVLPTVIIFFITCLISLFFLKSSKNEVLTKLNQCTDLDAVHTLVNEKYSLIESDTDFSLKVREKLNSFHLSQSEIDSCLMWLPNTPEHLNLILIPDLSDRINDSQQRERDIEILRNIWNAFVKYAIRRAHSKDRLIVTIDENQTTEEFEKIADKLIYDMGEIGNKMNRDYLNDYRKSVFIKNIKKLYSLNEQFDRSANFKNLIRGEVIDLYRPNTLYNRYTNKLIILSAGLPSQNDSSNFCSSHIVTLPFSILICEVFDVYSEKESKNWEKLFDSNGILVDQIEYAGKSPALERTFQKVNEFTLNN